MSRLRLRWLIAGLTLVAILLAAIVAVPALYARANGNDAPSYLALGDSVAFGTNPLLDPSAVNQHQFVGYPTPVADGVDEPLTNAACPGETSSHFVDLQGSDNGCGSYPGPLHVNASYAQETQLAFALDFLKQHPRTQLITITIGANDLFVLQRTCRGDPGCILQAIGAPGQPGPFSLTLAANLSTIYGAIRGMGYRGQIVALTYYSLNYSDQLGTAAIGAVDQVVAGVTQAYGGKVADGFDAFQGASTAFNGDTCAAGLRIALPSGGCDIHPSEAGRNLLAQAVLGALA
jgi:lysophospholipase L1-like esterase